MAVKDFDFDQFKQLNMVAYLKEYCKPAILRKCKGGILLVDYKLSGKKIPLIFIPTKKYQEADRLFKQIKANKEHLLKKTVLVEMAIGKDVNGEAEIAFTLKKGGLGAEDIKTKGALLFGSKLKMNIKVLNTEQVSDENSSEEESTEIRGLINDSDYQTKRKAHYDKLKVNIDKALANLGRIAEDKLLVAIQKYEAALNKLMGNAEGEGPIAEEEQEVINELSQSITRLKARGEQGMPVKELTPERRAKIQENMGVIQKRIQKMMQQLGL